MTFLQCPIDPVVQALQDLHQKAKRSWRRRKRRRPSAQRLGQSSPTKSSIRVARWPSNTSPPLCHPTILNMITNLEACGRNTTSYQDSFINTSYLFYQCNIIIMTYKNIHIYIYGCLVFMWHFWHDQGLVFIGFLGMKHAIIWPPMCLDGWYIHIIYL